MIGIICDSGTDVPRDFFENDNILEIPLNVQINNVNYQDWKSINPEQVLEFMKNNFPKTSTPSYKTIKDSFLELYKKGYKKILGITISSALSGTNNLFSLVSRELMEEYDDLQVEIIDSINISTGSGNLVIKASKLIEKGFSFDQIVSEIKKSINKSKVFFVIPTLKFLRAGGRIGNVAGVVGELLSIKPIITVGEDGKYKSIAKPRSMSKAIDKILNLFKDFVMGETIDFCSIGICSKDDKSISFVNKIKNYLLEEFSIKDIYNYQPAPSMISHTGPGLIGLSVLIK